jgi:hypothetical protein
MIQMIFELQKSRHRGINRRPRGLVERKTRWVTIWDRDFYCTHGVSEKQAVQKSLIVIAKEKRLKPAYRAGRQSVSNGGMNFFRLLHCVRNDDF